MKQQIFYITNQDKFDNIVQEILELASAQDILHIGLDTEFTRDGTYHPTLSLLQLCFFDSNNEKKICLIDFFSSVDFTALTQILLNPKIIKIVHSLHQDLQALYHKFSVVTKSAFDTQIMANFLGYKINASYSCLAENLLNKKMDKSQQRSDWGARPLKVEQLDYACEDVNDLIEIYQRLKNKLDENSRFEWFMQENQLQIDKVFTKSTKQILKQFEFETLDRFRINNLSKKQLATIGYLTLWRDQYGAKHNISRKKVCSNNVIESLAISELKEIYWPKNVAREELEQIRDQLEEIQSCETKISSFLINYGKKMSGKEVTKYKSAKNLIEEISLQTGLDCGFLVTAQTLKEIILGEVDFDKAIFGWRADLYGERLRKLMGEIE